MIALVEMRGGPSDGKRIPVQSGSLYEGYVMQHVPGGILKWLDYFDGEDLTVHLYRYTKPPGEPGYFRYTGPG